MSNNFNNENGDNDENSNLENDEDKYYDENCSMNVSYDTETCIICFLIHLIN